MPTPQCLTDLPNAGNIKHIRFGVDYSGHGTQLHDVLVTLAAVAPVALCIVLCTYIYWNANRRTR